MRWALTLAISAVITGIVFLTAFDFDFKQVGKRHTVDIEGNNNRFRQRLRRVFRKTCCFSKKLENHFKVFDLLFHYVNYGWV